MRTDATAVGRPSKALGGMKGCSEKASMLGKHGEDNFGFQHSRLKTSLVPRVGNPHRRVVTAIVRQLRVGSNPLRNDVVAVHQGAAPGCQPYNLPIVVSPYASLQVAGAGCQPNCSDASVPCRRQSEMDAFD